MGTFSRASFLWRGSERLSNYREPCFERANSPRRSNVARASCPQYFFIRFGGAGNPWLGRFLFLIGLADVFHEGDARAFAANVERLPCGLGCWGVQPDLGNAKTHVVLFWLAGGECYGMGHGAWDAVLHTFPAQNPLSSRTAYTHSDAAFGSLNP